MREIRLPIDQELLAILVCPESRQPVVEAEAGLLARINAAVAKGSLKNRGGVQVAEPVEEGLVREDGRILYPVREGIPLMLVDEAIDLADS